MLPVSPEKQPPEVDTPVSEPPYVLAWQAVPEYVMSVPAGMLLVAGLLAAVYAVQEEATVPEAPVAGHCDGNEQRHMEGQSLAQPVLTG